MARYQHTGVSTPSEGASSDWVDVRKEVGSWPAQFRNDLGIMAQKFSITVKEPKTPGEFELHGPADAVAAAKTEFGAIGDFYRKEQRVAAIFPKQCLH